MSFERFRHTAAAVLLGVPLISCGSSARKAPIVPSPSVARPAVYVPADMDLVMRLDVRRFREPSGPEPELSLVRLWEAFGPGASQSRDSREPLLQLLKTCDSLWLGCKITSQGCRDFVIVLRGHFTRPYGEYGFARGRRKRDLGGGWLSYDLPPVQRSSVARLYWKPPELAVLVSSAELDSAERSVEQLRDNSTLEPSEDGVMSLVARSRALARVLRQRSPKGADWLEQSQRIEMRFDPTAAASEAKFTVAFDDESRAKRSAEAFQILVSGLLGLDARLTAGNVLLEQLGSNVVLRVILPTIERGHE